MMFETSGEYLLFCFMLMGAGLLFILVLLTQISLQPLFRRVRKVFKR